MSMNMADLLAVRLLASTGSITEGHFACDGEKHTNRRIRRGRLHTEPVALFEACESIALAFFNKGIRVEAIVGRSIDGARIALVVSNALSKLYKKPIPSTYVIVMPDGNIESDSCFGEIVSNKMVVYVEDLLIEARTTRLHLEAIQKFGGEIIGVGSIYKNPAIFAGSLGGVRALCSLTDMRQMDISTYDASKCPLCAKGVPLLD